MKTASVMSRALFFGAILTAAVAIAGSIIGYLVAGVSGLLSALVAAALTAFFLGCTTLSVYVAERVTRDRPSVGIYFGIVLGAWGAKFLVYIGLLVVLQGQPWINPWVFFVALIVAVLGSLTADIIAVAGAQVSASTGLQPPSTETAP